MSQTHELSPAASLEREEQQPEKKTKSRRPPNTAFRQQRLKAWQLVVESRRKVQQINAPGRPILTPKTVLPIFYVVGVLFALFGGLMLYASSEVQELALDYTNCNTSAPLGSVDDVGEPMGSSRVVSHFKTNNNSRANTEAVNQARWSRQNIEVPYGNGDYRLPTSQCTIQFYVPNNIKPPIYMYYRLTNFYQNHRRYVKSLDQQQLNGDFRSNTTISNSACDPLETNGTNGETGFAYYPCGLIANSMFNDTIQSPLILNPPGETVDNRTYPMTERGVGWPTDAELYGKTAYTNDQVAPPPNWQLRYPNGYNDEFPIPNLHEDESFWVWMRTAGLPTFSKLARRNDNETMPRATYQLQIYDYFPAGDYGGTKEILISTRTVLGGKNPFLGIAYVVVAGVCILLGAIFTAMHLIKPRKLGDHTYLSWNNDQPTAATVASGRSTRPNEA